MVEESTNDLGITKIDHIPILAFHKLVPDETKREKYIKNQWIGSIDVFSKMMQWLYINDYKTINTEEFYRWYKGDIDYYNKTVLITFDDGFYDVYYLVYPILKKYNFKATSFLVGNRINKETPMYNKSKEGFIGEDIIEKMRKEYPNIEFQSHSYNMHFLNKYHKFRINNMTLHELKNDTLVNSKYNFTVMAYPFGKYNKNIERILKKQGYLCAFTFTPDNYATRNSDQYAIPRIKINGFANIDYMIKWVKN